MWSGSEEGSYLRLIDFVSLNSRLESKKEEERRLDIVNTLNSSYQVASEATPALEGHVMAHPTDEAAVFGMLCYM